MRILLLILTTLLFLNCGETPPSAASSASNKDDNQAQKSDNKDLSEGKLLAINGTNLYVKTIGKGEPLLIIHGGPGLDHTYFLPQMEALAQNHELIFYDQRASGKSAADFDSTQISMDIFIEDIESLRQGFRLDQLNILGHSFGGILAMKYAIKYPDKVKKLILSNSSGASARFVKEAQKELMARITEEDKFEQDLIFNAQNFQQKRASAYQDLFRIFFRKEFFNRELASELTLTFPENFAKNSQTLSYLSKDMGANYDFQEELKRITAPTLVIYGDYEILAESAGKAIVNTIPDADFLLLKDCGHFPFIEQPSAYFSAITEFLK